MQENYRSIRMFAGNAGCGARHVVIMIHPWRKRWAFVFCEDIYGMSEVLADRLAVREAIRFAKDVRKFLRKHNGCLAHLTRSEIASAVAKIDTASLLNPQDTEVVIEIIKKGASFDFDEEEDISHDPGGACFNNCDTCRKCGGA